MAFKKCWNFIFFNQRIPKNKYWPEPLRQLSLLVDADWSGNLYSLGSDQKLPTIPTKTEIGLRSVLLEDEEAWVKLKKRIPSLESDKKRICLFPGSIWATKRWTEDGFVEVSRSLVQKNNQVLICGSKEEQDLCERIAKQSPGSVNLGGHTSVYESAILLAHSNLMVGNDSASTHLATVAEISTITLFGPTILEFGYRPWSNQAYVLQTNLSCRPCGPHGHHKCPIGTHDCMKKISAKEVQNLVSKLV